MLHTRHSVNELHPYGKYCLDIDALAAIVLLQHGFDIYQRVIVEGHFEDGYPDLPRKAAFFQQSAGEAGIKDLPQS